MARRKKISFALIGILVIIGTWLFAFGLPWGIQAYTVYQLEQLTGQQITLSEVSLDYVNRAITMKGLQVVEAGGRRPMLALEELQVHFRLWPLWNKHIMLPRVMLDHPTLTIIRASDGHLNVNQLLRKDQEPSEEAGFQIIVKEFQLKEGTVTYQDYSHPAQPRVQIDHIAFHLSNFSTQSAEPIPIQLQAALAGQGRVIAKGRMKMSPFSLESEWEVMEAELSPYQEFLAGFPPISGTLDTSFHLLLPPHDSSAVRVEGNGVLYHLQAGSPPSPFLTAQRLEVSDVKLIWPEQLIISRILVHQVSVEILRDQDGNLPILSAFKGERPQKPDKVPDQPALIPTVGEIQINEGRIRFIDQFIQPEYQKTLTGLTISIDQLDSAPDQIGHLKMTASTPEEESIVIEGEVRLFGGGMFLNVDGTVKELSVSSFNPYAEEWLGWGSRSGYLTTNFDIHIEEQHLESKSKIGISDLRVVRAGTEDLVDRKLGLPLGLLVDLIKNIHGDIKLNIEVEGPLDKPEFSIGNAIWKSLRNAVINIAAAPLRLIGSLIKKQSKIQQLDIHPVQFKAGTVTMKEGMEERIQHFQKFLTNTPYIQLTVIPVISARDLNMLRIRKVASRIAELEAREPSLKGGKAAQSLYQERFPDKQPPQEEVKLMQELVAVEPETIEHATALAGKRADLFMEKLTTSPGITRNRLHLAKLRMTSHKEAFGGLEFSISR